jgi:hypothetical protein
MTYLSVTHHELRTRALEADVERKLAHAAYARAPEQRRPRRRRLLRAVRGAAANA